MTPETPFLLLRVGAAWALPGLGLLVLPDGPTPYLAACDLHTALAIEVHLPDGTRRSGSATVEEVSRPEATMRSLLLDLDLELNGGLSVGTTIWLARLAPALI